jgi:hypothetical protein
MKHITLSLSLLAATSICAQEVYDATMLSHVGLKYSCEGEFRPVLRIQNTGTVAMSSCVIEIWKNGLVSNTFDWQLALPAQPQEIRQPVLPPVLEVEALDELVFRIISVNEQPDEAEEGNDLVVQVAEGPVPYDTYISMLEVVTNDAPLGTSWIVYDATGVVVAQGGPYTEPLTTHVVWVALEASKCYAVLVSDAGADGTTDAEVRMFSNGVPAIDTTLTVGGVLDLGFITGVIATVPEHERIAGLQVYPNPTDGLVRVQLTDATVLPAHIELFDATGRLVRVLRHAMESDGGMTLDLAGHPDGVYFLRFRMPDGSSAQQRLVLAR